MTPFLALLEIRLRCAAACRQYEDASRLAAESGEATRAYAQALPAGDPRAGEAAHRLDETFSWALLVMQAARSSCADELSRVATATQYSRPCGEPARSRGLRLEG